MILVRTNHPYLRVECHIHGRVAVARRGHLRRSARRRCGAVLIGVGEIYRRFGIVF
jgi:hypothetical protein